MTDAIPGPAETPAVAAADSPTGESAAGATAAPVAEAVAAPVAPAVEQASLAAPPPPPPAPRGLSYAVDIVFCVDVTGSMTPILDQVKANALRFFGDVQSNLTAKGKTIEGTYKTTAAGTDSTVDEGSWKTTAQ